MIEKPEEFNTILHSLSLRTRANYGNLDQGIGPRLFTFLSLFLCHQAAKAFITSAATSLLLLS